MIEYVCLIVKTYIFGPVFEQTLAINLSGCVFEMSRNLMMILFSHIFSRMTFLMLYLFIIFFYFYFENFTMANMVHSKQRAAIKSEVTKV